MSMVTGFVTSVSAEDEEGRGDLVVVVVGKELLSLPLLVSASANPKYL